jgi:type IV secretion system protein VirB6
MSGLFTAIGGTLENGTTTYVTNVSAALSSALVPAVTTAVTIWIVTYGLAVVRGEAHEAVPAFAWRALKLAITLAFALSTGVYQGQVVTAINGATAGLAQTVQNAAAVSGAGNPGCGSVNGSSVTGASAASIYQTLDCYDQQIDLVMDAYFDKATHEGLGLSMVVAAIADFACGLIAALGGSIFLIVLAFEVVMARMLLDLLLGLGPLFIACAAFGPTTRFFEAWTAKVANYALLQVLVAAFLGMALTAFSAYLAPLHATDASPASDAASLMSGITSALDGSAAAVAAIGLFVTGVRRYSVRVRRVRRWRDVTEARPLARPRAYRPRWWTTSGRHDLWRAAFWQWPVRGAVSAGLSAGCPGTPRVAGRVNHR